MGDKSDFEKWFDREVEIGVRYSDNLVASLGPWSERREAHIRTQMRLAFEAGQNVTRTAYNRRLKAAIEAL